MRTRIPLLCALVLAAGACSGLSALDGGGDAGSFSPGERDSIRGQADRALEEQRFDAAWNQEIHAGADRARLEIVAVAALAGRSRHAEAMFAALRSKHGTLSDAARGRVVDLVSAARAQDDWSRALQIELLTAEDAPTFKRALAVYRAAPANRAPALLELLSEARARHEEASD